jgi:hypothetical protein
MRDFVTEYYLWLKNKTFSKKIGDVTRISLPFLNYDNDYTEIYICPTSDKTFTITDGGETLNLLELSGLSFTQKRKELLNMITASLGVNIKSDNSLSVDAGTDDVIIKKHLLVQCIMKISDLFYLKNSTVQSIFLDDIVTFFDNNNIRYVSNATLIGKSKLPCQFDFIIPKSSAAPERMIKAMNKLDNNNAKLLIFNWEDTQQVRAADSRLYAFINNIDKEAKVNTLSSLAEYNIQAVEWTNRNKYSNELAS